MAKKMKLSGNSQNVGGNAAVANHRPAPPANVLHFIQPRASLPPKVAPHLRRRLEISIDPETHTQIVMPIKFIGRD